MRVVMTLAALALLAQAGASSAAAADLEKIGNWSIIQDKDSVTDVITVSAQVNAGKSDALLLQCEPWRPKWRRVMVIHLPYLGFGRGFVDYRIDDKRVHFVSADFNKKNASFAEPDVVGPFFAELPGAKRVRIRASDGVADPAENDFDVTGVEPVLARLAALCDGPPAP